MIYQNVLRNKKLEIDIKHLKLAVPIPHSNKGTKKSNFKTNFFILPEAVPPRARRKLGDDVTEAAVATEWWDMICKWSKIFITRLISNREHSWKQKININNNRSQLWAFTSVSMNLVEKVLISISSSHKLNKHLLVSNWFCRSRKKWRLPSMW